MARKKPAKQQSRQNKANLVRIIAGQWRGRKLSFADVPGLRPTPDRVRETLFNWLQGHLHEARCLDLFAGSGALGLEALSRGAVHLTLVEKNAQAARILTENLSLLKAGNAEVVRSDGMLFLKSQSRAYDIIFLDPPFHKSYLSEILSLIQERGLLTVSGMLYIEHEVEENIEALMQVGGMALHKQVKAGQVVSSLYTGLR